ncbi:MAG TPA: FABP family protein, partial [Acidimicrobiales bacterium]|nr:FABP family protein [Acidimicrobiales bacterium]
MSDQVSKEDEIPLHPDVEPLAFLLGTWQGEGTGEYPTIGPFAFREEVLFSHNGKPFLAYAQRTWSLENGIPMHSETGFLRLCGPAPRRLEIVVAHSTGLVEIAEGILEPGKIELISTNVSGTSTAKTVTAVGRSIIVDGDVYRYRLRMAAGGLP